MRRISGTLRAIAASTALLVSLAPGASQLANAQKPGSLEAELSALIRQADGLLARLEYQRGREMLEEAAREPRFRRAKPAVRARLYAELGRARAELGDVPGMDDAFAQAVILDRGVRLPRSASPKILAALERARANAPPPTEEEEVRKPPPRQERPKPADAGVRPAADSGRRRISRDAGVRSEDATRDAATRDAATRDAAAPAAPRDAGLALAPDAGVRADAGAIADAAAADAAPAVEPREPEKAAIEVRVDGALVANGRARILARLIGIPPQAKVFARVRRGSSTRFERLPMIRTGTIAGIELRLESPRYEVYLEATRSKRVIATAYSAESPLVIEPAPLPSLSDAWAEARPLDVQTSTVTAETSTVAVVPPLVEQDGLGETEILIIAGSIVAAALITTAIIIIASSGSDCEAEEGFGCTEIRVLPLLSF